MTAPTQITITTGTVTTVSGTNILVKMNSPTAGNKTVYVEGTPGDLTTIVIFDLYGAIHGSNAGGADTYPITPVALSGNIYGMNELYTCAASLTLNGATEGWVSI